MMNALIGPLLRIVLVPAIVAFVIIATGQVDQVVEGVVNFARLGDVLAQVNR